MPFSEITGVVSNNITLTAGGGTTTSSSVDTTTNGPTHVGLKLTNGATGPTTPARGVIQTSCDNTNFYDFYTFNGGTGNNEVKSVAMQIPLIVPYFRVVWTPGNTGSDITARADYAALVERSESWTENSTNNVVKAGDATNNAVRVVVVSPQIRNLVTSNMITLTTTAETTLLAAGGVGVFLDVTDILLTNTSTTDTRVDIRDATTGTVRMSINLLAGSNAIICLATPSPQTTANNNWTAQLATAVTDVRITATAVRNI